MTELDHIDSMVVSAVAKVRAMFNEAQRRLGLPVTDHSNETPFQEEEPCKN